MKKPADRLFDISLSAADKIRTRLKDIKLSNGELDKFRPLLYFFARAYKSCEVVRLLWAHGFVEDAYSVTRTIYELRLQARFIAEDLTSRSLQFTENIFVTALEYYRRTGRRDDSEAQGIARDIERLRTEFRRSNGLPETAPKYQPNWWGGGRIKKLVKALGLPLDQEYDVIYFMLSDHVHSSTSLTHRYATRDQNALATFASESSNSLTVPLER
jgi:hypothetical protein